MIAVVCETREQYRSWCEREGVSPHSKQHIAITGKPSLKRVRGLYLDDLVVLSRDALTPDIRAALLPCFMRSPNDVRAQLGITNL